MWSFLSDQFLFVFGRFKCAFFCVWMEMHQMCRHFWLFWISHDFQSSSFFISSIHCLCIKRKLGGIVVHMKMRYCCQFGLRTWTMQGLYTQFLFHCLFIFCFVLFIASSSSTSSSSSLRCCSKLHFTIRQSFRWFGRIPMCVHGN